MGKMAYKTNLKCLNCGNYEPSGNVLHHIKTRGSGGSDSVENLMPLCVMCHTKVHQIGLLEFSNNEKVESYLRLMKWYRCELTDRWRHDD